MTRVVLLKPNSYEVSFGQVVGIDLSSYSDPDYISVICPSMSDDIDLTNSYFEMTSGENGDFESNIASVSFDDTTNVLDLPGDTELRFNISAFSSIDLSSVTGIRFRIKATSNIVFKTMGIRAVDADWQYAPVDIDTISQCLELPVSPTGDPSFDIGFPVELTESMFDYWPIAWQDINPRDFSVSMEFLTGSLEGDNSFGIFFRGGNLNKGIVNDLEDWENSSSPATMGELNGLSLETDISDPASAAFEYLGAIIKWNADDPTIKVYNSLNEIHSFSASAGYSFTFEPDTRYMATFISHKDTFRIKIYDIDPDLGSIRNLIFDSPVMSGTIFSPRQGFFGWWANFEDGDSAIDNIRHRGASFGELTTRQFQSITPAVGAQLVHTSSPAKELVQSFGSGPFGGIVTEAAEADTYRIVSQGKMEGIQTNEFVISDWENTILQFEISKAPGKYTCYLLGAAGNIIELNIAGDYFNQWDLFRYELGGRNDPTGRYRLIILKTSSQDNTTWYVRNVKAQTRIVHWSARNQDDPWNMAPEEWMPFGETTNKSNSGMMFKEPGYVQVKASLTNNDARISEFHIVPRYAQLGRLVFDEVDPDTIKHTMKIMADVNDLRVDFGIDLQLSETDPRVPIGYIWIFDSTNDWYTGGDTIRKVFSTPGDHHAFCQITYNDGSVQSDYWKAYLTA